VAERLAWTKPCRSLDLWHLAIALEIQAEVFVTFDKDQFALAQAEGLQAIIPS
jgi:predicted nucleic acid-binding protein